MRQKVYNREQVEALGIEVKIVTNWKYVRGSLTDETLSLGCVWLALLFYTFGFTGGSNNPVSHWYESWPF